MKAVLFVFFKKKKKERKKKNVSVLRSHTVNLSIYKRASHVTEFHKNSLSRFMILQKTPGKTAWSELKPDQP